MGIGHVNQLSFKLFGYQTFPSRWYMGDLSFLQLLKVQSPWGLPVVTGVCVCVCVHLGTGMHTPSQDCVHASCSAWWAGPRDSQLVSLLSY